MILSILKAIGKEACSKLRIAGSHLIDALEAIGSVIVILLGILFVHWWFIAFRYLRCIHKDRKSFAKHLRSVRAGELDYYVLMQWRSLLNDRTRLYPSERRYRILSNAVSMALKRQRYSGGPAH